MNCRYLQLSSESSFESQRFLGPPIGGGWWRDWTLKEQSLHHHSTLKYLFDSLILKSSKNFASNCSKFNFYLFFYAFTLLLYILKSVSHLLVNFSVLVRMRKQKFAHPLLLSLRIFANDLLCLFLGNLWGDLKDLQKVVNESVIQKRTWLWF